MVCMICMVCMVYTDIWIYKYIGYTGMQVHSTIAMGGMCGIDEQKA